MSLISDAMQDALTELATVTGQSVEYRTGAQGTWIALTGAFLEPNPAQPMMFDDQRHMIHQPETATLKVKTGQARMKSGKPPAGYLVRHTNGTNQTVWGVVGAAHGDGLSVYDLVRDVAQSSGDPRGAVG